MRILHVTTEFPPLIFGGLGTAVGGLATASVRAGLQVAVLLVGGGHASGYDGPPEVGSYPGESSVRQSIVLHAVPHATAIDDALAFVRAWRPDVVHVHVFWLAHVAFAIRAATGVPIVYTVHSLDRAEYDIGEGPPECLTQWQVQAELIATADRVVALTVDERDLIDQYGLNVHSRVRVVGNGIDDSASARLAARGRREREAVTVLYAGRFVDRKGLRELLAAAPAVLAQAPHVRFVLAGGHRFASAESMAAFWLPDSCRPYRDRIAFTGWLSPDRVAEWYAAADVLVVPSWYEPFGMVILEGMLYGLAILATSVGGPMEILADEHTGLLCAPRDPVDLERQLLRLVRDSALRMRLGREAAGEVRARWLYRHVVDQMCSVYVEVTEELPRGRSRRAA